MPPKKKRRGRTDTAPEQSRIMAAALMTIEPPAHVTLRPRDIPFFNSIIKEIVKADWTDHGVEVACMMARTMADLELQQRLMRKEGAILRTAKSGYPMLNPRKSLIQLHMASMLALRRSLALHARAQGVNPDDMARRSSALKDIENLTKDFDDDLIARPGRVN